MQDKWNEINNDDIKVVKMDKNPINPKTHMEQMTKLQKEIQDLKLQLNDSLQRTNSFKKMVKQLESDIGLIEQLNPNLRRKR
jgi:septal ring factor EnvC (AmiA/AmiB activator)